MPRASAFWFLTPIVVAIGLTPRADARPDPIAAPVPETIKVGIMGGMFTGVPAPLVKAGGEQFGGLFKTITGLPGEADVEDDFRALAKRIDDKQLHLGVFHGFEWAWVKGQYPNLAPLAITIPSKLPQACIVVHAQSKIGTPNELKGAAVHVPLNMKAHGYLYIDQLLANNLGAFVPAPKKDLGPHEALDEVVEGTSKAALVDIATLTAYRKSVPGRATLLKVLCQSEPFPQTVLVHRKDGLPKAVLAQLQAGLLKADKTPAGKAFLFMWNLKGFEESTQEFDNLVKKSLIAYPAPRPRPDAAPQPR